MVALRYQNLVSQIFGGQVNIPFYAISSCGMWVVKSQAKDIDTHTRQGFEAMVRALKAGAEKN